MDTQTSVNTYIQRRKRKMNKKVKQSCKHSKNITTAPPATMKIGHLNVEYTKDLSCLNKYFDHKQYMTFSLVETNRHNKPKPLIFDSYNMFEYRCNRQCGCVVLSVRHEFQPKRLVIPTFQYFDDVMVRCKITSINNKKHNIFSSCYITPVKNKKYDEDIHAFFK